MAIELRVNGYTHLLDVDPARSLLSVLRDGLALTGAKFGCGEGECGACTVLLDGSAAHACKVPVGEVAGREITTIEGLVGEGGSARTLVAAFVRTGAFQCAFCTPGMVVAAAALLAANPHPTDDQVVAALDGNLCRCGTYPRILDAVRLAAGSPAEGSLAGDDVAAAVAAGAGEAAAAAYVDTAELLRYPLAVRGAQGERTETVLLPAGGLVALLLQPDSYAPGPPAQGGPESIVAWVHVAADGRVTGFTGKVEMGQGNRTSLAQMVAEEMRVPAGEVSMCMGDTDRTPWDMGTFGSLSTPQAGRQLRIAAAAARRLLDQGATGVHVVRGEGPLRPATEWTEAGKAEPRTAAWALATGVHHYTSDMRLPGMLYGKVLRPPRVGASLVSADAQSARAMAGVVVVQEDEFLGVAAPSTGLAVKALASVRAEWAGGSDLSGGPELLAQLRRTAAPRGEAGPGEWGGPVHMVEGDPDAALAAAERSLQRTYTIAHIAHVPLETRAALAVWQEGALTVWTGTQRPFEVRDRLAEALELPEERVRVIVPDTGSGYGGKHTPECALEAARLARAAGRPVRVVWTREEEFRWAYFRPAGLVDVRAAFRSDGVITALELDNINSGAAGIHPVYAIPNQRLVFRPADLPVREGSYRALAATANHFAREMLIDEIAETLAIDPVELRLRNLTDDRAREVLEAVAGAEAGAADSSTSRSTKRGWGVALGFEKGSYVATGVEVEVPEGWDGGTASVGRAGLRVRRVVTAFDCGAVVNPDNLRNQIVGATIMGLGGALFEAIDLEDGVVANARLSQYRVPRFSDVPPIEVIVLDRKDTRPAGAGETPIVAIAPAIGAAISRATGMRPTGMPMAR